MKMNQYNAIELINILFKKLGRMASFMLCSLKSSIAFVLLDIQRSLWSVIVPPPNVMLLEDCCDVTCNSIFFHKIA